VYKNGKKIQHETEDQNRVQGHECKRQDNNHEAAGACLKKNLEECEDK